MNDLVDINPVDVIDNSSFDLNADVSINLEGWPAATVILGLCATFAYTVNKLCEYKTNSNANSKETEQ